MNATRGSDALPSGAAMKGHPPLLDMLGVCWNLDAPVVDLAWDHVAGSIAFALGDGSLAVAPGRWKGGPHLQPRPGGGVALLAAEEPAPPPRKAIVHQGACLALAADPSGGFLSGGDDGRVVHMPLAGNGTVLAHLPDWIDNVAASREGARAWSSGRRVERRGGATSGSIELPATATALAFDASGQRLAMAHAGGVTLWDEAEVDERRSLAWPGLHRALAWSPDGRYLVTGMQENALHGWRLADGGDIELGGYSGQPRSLSFSGDGRFLATSGATRAVCWRFDPPHGNEPPAECGIVSQVPVTRVACHPSQAVVAAGYHNGAVLLCQPGSSESIFVKASGDGAVTALAWAGDGSRLALGTQGGAFGWLALPAALFRTAPAR